MSEVKIYQDQFQAAVTGIPFRRLGNGAVLDVLRAIIEDILEKADPDQLTDEQKQAILGGIKWGYDNVFRPIDIPWVPEILERRGEDLLWSVLEAQIKTRLKMD